MKIKIFKTSSNFKKRDFHINPNIGWRFILCMVFVLILASVVLGFYLFGQVSEKSIAPAPDIGGQAGTIKKERIEKVLEYFSERETRSTKIINSPSSVADPSL